MMNDKNATELINSLQEGEFRLSIKKTDEGGISINITPISFSESTASTVTLDSTASNRDKIKELLMQMGMKVSNKGYSYLIDAIEYVMSKDKLNESTNISVTKELICLLNLGAKSV